MHLGWSEILFILVVILLLFGAKRIPEIARSLGKASGEFKRAKDEFAEGLKAESQKDSGADEQK